MSTIVTKGLPYPVDLEEPIKKTYLETLLFTEDNEAHKFDIQLFRGETQVDLPDGTIVTGRFIRHSDNATIKLDGIKAANVASVTLNHACYSKPGQFTMFVKVQIGDTVSTVFYGEGSLIATITDNIVDA